MKQVKGVFGLGAFACTGFWSHTFQLRGMWWTLDRQPPPGYRQKRHGETPCL